jgi:hypothetical protein
VTRILFCLLAAAGFASFAPTPRNAGLADQARASSGPAFTLGVLRRDGIIIPFASYDGARWANRWPAPGRLPDIPLSIAGSPKSWWLNDRPLGLWTVWPTRGDSQVVHVTSPINVTVECQAQIGLQTDYTSIELRAEPRMQPYPKDGLASAGDVLVEPPALLDAQSPEWKRASADVSARIFDRETKLLADSRIVLAVPDPARRTQEFALEVLYRSAGPRTGTTLLYFEGVKRYPARRVTRDAATYVMSPDVMTYAIGYVLLDPQAPPRVSESVTLSDSRREGLLYTIVLGTFRVADKLFWAVQRSGWGFERFDVVDMAEPDPKNVFTAAGGSCRQ